MEKTAVEWLLDYIEAVNKKGAIFIPSANEEIVEHVKLMQRKQLEDAYWDGGQDVPLTEERCKEYYEEKYLKK